MIDPVIDPNEFLMSSGIPSASFDAVGDKIVGTVVDVTVRQARDFVTGEPATWPNGKPKRQLVVTLQTDESSGELDDGRRRLFALESAKPGSMLTAIQRAVRKSGAPLEVGGRLAVVFVGEEPPSQRGFNPRKLYEAAYTPASTDAVSALLDAPAPPSVSADDLV